MKLSILCTKHNVAVESEYDHFRFDKSTGEVDYDGCFCPTFDKIYRGQEEGKELTNEELKEMACEHTWKVVAEERKPMKRVIKGSEVKIRLEGRLYQGTVISANNYGTEEQPNWYIEFDHNQQSHGQGYGYWKQAYDGGKLEE